MTPGLYLPQDLSAVPDTETGLGAIPRYPVEALPAAAQEIVSYGERSGLPAALIAGPALGALATAIGPHARTKVSGSWEGRPIVWVAVIAPPGAGKSPGQDLAYAPLHDHDAQLDPDDESAQRLLSGDLTLEALARTLHGADEAASLDLDELAVLLRGAGEYKRGGGGDRGRLLSLWSGRRWSYTRVGSGTATNGIDLHIDHPTLVICGGLQPAVHDLLGGEGDGLRPRWLPHIAPLPEETGDLSEEAVPAAWQLLLGRDLIPRRDQSRARRLDAAAQTVFTARRRAWKAQAREGVETATVAAALVKADVHLARIALILAEADDPGSDAPITSDQIERAGLIVDYTLDCWRSLPEQGGMALSRRDHTLDEGIARLIPWVEAHGGEVTRRDLQRACVAGARTPADLDALLDRYEASYPGSVIDGRRIVRAPARRCVGGVGTADTVSSTGPDPRHSARSSDVGTADTAPADTGSADTAPTPDDWSARRARRERTIQRDAGQMEIGDIAEAELERIEAKFPEATG